MNFYFLQELVQYNHAMSHKQYINFREPVPETYSRDRIDQVASKMLPELSRTQLTEYIKQGLLLINNQQVKPSERVTGGELLSLNVTIQEKVADMAEPVDFAILYEDESILVVNKPPGLVVHPAAGNPSGTLLNGLLNHDVSLASLPRAGIIHRLDKDTSGILSIAKTEQSRQSLINQLQNRTMRRSYIALCHGHPNSGSIDAPIGRHPIHRKKMAVQPSGKPAKTHYETEQVFSHFSQLMVQLESGRTHQIRVHLQHIGHPLFADATYSRKRESPALLQLCNRQALHAANITLTHPNSGKTMSFSAPIPNDMQLLFNYLQKHRD